MNVLQPVHVSLVKTLRDDLHQTSLDCAHGRGGQRCHFDKPLLGDQWLNWRVATLTKTQWDRVSFCFDEQTQLLELLHNILASLVTILARIGTGLAGHFAIEANNLNAW